MQTSKDTDGWRLAHKAKKAAVRVLCAGGGRRLAIRMEEEGWGGGEGCRRRWLDGWAVAIARDKFGRRMGVPRADLRFEDAAKQLPHHPPGPVFRMKQ